MAATGRSSPFQRCEETQGKGLMATDTNWPRLHAHKEPDKSEKLV